MTGFGNFSYYYIRKDFSVAHFAQFTFTTRFLKTLLQHCQARDCNHWQVVQVQEEKLMFFYFAVLGKHERDSKSRIILWSSTMGLLYNLCILCFFQHI